MEPKLIAANWKMNKTVAESISFIENFKKIKLKNNEIVILPAFTSLKDIKNSLRGTKIKLGAQNMHYENEGALTGEISPVMLKDIGCDYVILGHSERREIFKEDNNLINKKVVSALKHLLKPILCIGEDLKQRKSGRTKEILKHQLKHCLEGISKAQMLKITIAYEPVWAISKGNPNHKAAAAEDAEHGHRSIRKIIDNIYDSETSKKVRLVYGGSMKPENAKELLSMPNINGCLVGNASLNPASFAEICNSYGTST